MFIKISSTKLGNKIRLVITSSCVSLAQSSHILSPVPHMCQCHSRASDVSCSPLIGGHHLAQPTPASLAASPGPDWLRPVTWPHPGISLVLSIPGPASSQLPLAQDIIQDPPLISQDIDPFTSLLLFFSIILDQAFSWMIILKAFIIRSLPDVLYVLRFLAPVCDGEPQPHLHALHQTRQIRATNPLVMTNQRTAQYQVIEPWHHLRLPYGTESQKIIKSIPFLRATQSGIYLTTPGVISGMVNFPCFMMTGPR